MVTTRYAETKPGLVGEQKRYLEKTIEDYQRKGMHLAEEQRERVRPFCVTHECTLHCYSFVYGGTIAGRSGCVFPKTLPKY